MGLVTEPSPMVDRPIALEPVTILRGARVQVDALRAGRVIVGVCLGGLALAAGLLFWSGAHKNAQIDALRQHGVAVQDRVGGCLGQLGGSGSNAAGYTCTGTFSLDGQRYTETIPGSTLLAPGATIRIVAVPGDPPLIATAPQVASERPSGSVFVLPTVFLGVLVLVLGATVLRRQAIPPGQ